MKEINAKEITVNPFKLLNETWGVLAAGDENKATGMTVSWGAVGMFWEKPAVTVYIRPQRFTKTFIDDSERFSLSFLPDSMRKVSTSFGSLSGNDGVNKFDAAGAEKAFEDGVPYVDGADMVFICKKLISGEFDPARIYDPADDAANYPDKDYHTYYIAEIEKVLVK
ncbi:MAG: flavin reductase [Eubacteriales bacterium]|jgi:flavin reductase (DIM6/NTAB) family NADH-FMN oxidoreductase RutF|nr:flavin reductase [Eubacteriales bacterium]